MAKLHPRERLKRSFVSADLTQLKWQIEAPTFIQVTNAAPQQRAALNDNRPWLFSEFRLNATNTGRFSGVIKARLGQRTFSLPVRVNVVEPAAPRRWLVTRSPFEATSTERGKDLDAVGEVFSEAKVPVDYLHQLPDSLAEYDFVLLGLDALADLSAEQTEMVRAFVNRGGRLLLCADRFFSDTRLRANDLLKFSGLAIESSEIPGYSEATNMTASPWTRGVGKVGFHRAVPITLTDPAKATLLANETTNTGWIATAPGETGGRIFVLCQSLWWRWLNDPQTAEYDNLQLFRNLLFVPEPTNR
jgi:hypothetical protein